MTEYIYQLRYSQRRKDFCYFVVHKRGYKMFSMHIPLSIIKYLRNMFQKLLGSNTTGVFYINIPFFTFTTHNIHLEKIAFGNILKGYFIFNYFPLHFNIDNQNNCLYFYNKFLYFLKDSPPDEIVFKSLFDEADFYSTFLRNLKKEML